jgi:hypothetical protein
MGRDDRWKSKGIKTRIIVPIRRITRNNYAMSISETIQIKLGVIFNFDELWVLKQELVYQASQG